MLGISTLIHNAGHKIRCLKKVFGEIRFMYENIWARINIEFRENVSASWLNAEFIRNTSGIDLIQAIEVNFSGDDPFIRPMSTGPFPIKPDTMEMMRLYALAKGNLA